MDNSRNRSNEYLGVNKIGKNIRKSPLHQPNFVNNENNNSNNNNGSPARQQPQPQVYNISKSDFRSIVQQLTGSPSRNSNDPLPVPPINPPPKHPSMRLQRIRPPPLTPVNRPPPPPVVPHQPPMQPPPFSYNNFARPQRPQFGQPSPRGVQPFGPSGSGWMNPALSPISAYMQQLQSCISDGGQNLYQPPNQAHAQPQPRMQFPGQAQGQGQPLASPRMNGGPALFPSPTSQFQMPSPSWFNMVSPTQRSPYPLLSPGIQFPPPLSPNFGFSSIGQSGILGPPSPGAAFPLSPSGFFNFPSPRWRNP